MTQSPEPDSSTDHLVSARGRGQATPAAADLDPRDDARNPAALHRPRLRPHHQDQRHIRTHRDRRHHARRAARPRRIRSSTFSLALPRLATQLRRARRRAARRCSRTRRRRVEAPALRHPIHAEAKRPRRIGALPGRPRSPQPDQATCLAVPLSLEKRYSHQGRPAAAAARFRRSDTGSHDTVPPSQACANTKAGLGRQVATHLLIASCASITVPRGRPVS